MAPMSNIVQYIQTLDTKLFSIHSDGFFAVVDSIVKTGGITLAILEYYFYCLINVFH